MCDDAGNYPKQKHSAQKPQFGKAEKWVSSLLIVLIVAVGLALTGAKPCWVLSSGRQYGLPVSLLTTL
jgi:hypothetical protein